jgi:ketosteroid isomerase-like protein
MRLATQTRFAPVLAILGILVVSVTAAAVATASAAPSDSPEAQRLRTTELERQHALVNADMAALDLLTADDFQLVPPPGIPLSRAEYVGAVAAGAIEYVAFEPASDMQVRLYGDAAALRYLAHIDVVVAGLGHFDTDAWVTDVYERRGGRWQIVWEQATAVGGFPPPAS